MSRSYATGEVDGDGDGSTTGGVVGELGTDGVVTDSYWDTETTGMDTSADGTGLTTSEFGDEANFENWVFEPATDWVWTMGTDAEGNDRPQLRWE